MSRSVFNNLIYSYKCPPVENFVFRLATRWTPLILLALSLVLTCKLTLGHSFACTTPYEALPQRFLETKCYSQGVQVQPQQRGYNDNARYSSSRMVRNDEEYGKHIRYYPWVNLVFLVHALVFYSPHLLWKAYECGYVTRLTSGLQVALGKEQKRALEVHCLAKHLLMTQGKHQVFACVWVFLEVCNFVISVSQIVWLVRFFDVAASPPTGLDVSTWSGYRDFYFPEEGSCLVAKITTSGERVTPEAMCVMPLNKLYMRMFFFLKSWYCFLALITVAVLIYRLALVVPKFRVLVLRITSPLAQRSTIPLVSFGDWVFLRAVQKSVTDVDFSRLLVRMHAMSQSKDSQLQDDDEEKSSIYEDSH